MASGGKRRDAWRFNIAQGASCREWTRGGAGPTPSWDEARPRALWHGVAAGAAGAHRGWSLLVIGVMEPQGADARLRPRRHRFHPSATAMDLFNLVELHEGDVVAAVGDEVPRSSRGIRRVLSNRDRGEEDFTITTQSEMLGTSPGHHMITVAVSGIAGNPLIVGAIGILTIMWISVPRATAEIGLLRRWGRELDRAGALPSRVGAARGFRGPDRPGRRLRHRYRDPNGGAGNPLKDPGGRRASRRF